MKKAILVVMGCIFLTGCNIFPGEQVKTDSLETKIKQNGGTKNDPVLINKDLPVEKLVITSKNGRHEFEVEIASDDKQRKIGLMNRTSLDENKGMLFAFQSSGIVDFWMKNTLIPLDIIFINEKGFIEHIARNVQPCTTATCPLYNSMRSVRYVLELKGGVVDKNEIKEGDKATWL